MGITRAQRYLPFSPIVDFIYRFERSCEAAQYRLSFWIDLTVFPNPPFLETMIGPGLRSLSLWSNPPHLIALQIRRPFDLLFQAQADGNWADFVIGRFLNHPSDRHHCNPRDRLPEVIGEVIEDPKKLRRREACRIAVLWSISLIDLRRRDVTFTLLYPERKESSVRIERCSKSRPNGHRVATPRPF